MKPSHVVALMFPIAGWVGTVWIETERYTVIRKGRTVAVIDPPGGCRPLYQRQPDRANATRRRNLTRFVTEEVYEW